MKRRALISVTDKTGVAEFARGLVEAGFSILSTGGTMKVIAEAGVAVEEVADYTAAITLEGTPPEQVAKTLSYRCISYGEQGEVEKAIADFTAAIGLEDAPPEQVALALIYRGETYEEQGEAEQEQRD